MENHKKHSLGRRAFALFFFRRVKLLFTLLFITGLAWYIEPIVPSIYFFWADYVVKGLLLLDLAYFLLLVTRTYLEYRYHTYMFTEDAFIMTRGYIIREEVATLYHQIQNVNIRRSPLDRIVGVSQVVILMSGVDRSRREGQMVLPAVGKIKASLVQRELLSRARRQHMAPFASAVETK